MDKVERFLKSCPLGRDQRQEKPFPVAPLVAGRHTLEPATEFVLSYGRTKPYRAGSYGSTLTAAR